MKVNWDDDIPKSYGKIKVMFQSPPTSIYSHLLPPKIAQQMNINKHQTHHGTMVQKLFDPWNLKWFPARLLCDVIHEGMGVQLILEVRRVELED